MNPDSPGELLSAEGRARRDLMRSMLIAELHRSRARRSAARRIAIAAATLLLLLATAVIAIAPRSIPSHQSIAAGPASSGGLETAVTPGDVAVSTSFAIRIVSTADAGDILARYSPLAEATPEVRPLSDTELLDALASLGISAGLMSVDGRTTLVASAGVVR